MTIKVISTTIVPAAPGYEVVSCEDGTDPFCVPIIAWRVDRLRLDLESDDLVTSAIPIVPEGTVFDTESEMSTIKCPNGIVIEPGGTFHDNMKDFCTSRAQEFKEREAKRAAKAKV